MRSSAYFPIFPLENPLYILALFLLTSVRAADLPIDPNQSLERTCFQTGSAYQDRANLRSDVAIVYGIDTNLPNRIKTWRDRGYRIHVMTGVSWGHYQDYLYGRFDGINHEDEAQTERSGKKISHGGDVYYMCPGTNFGKFLSVGVQRALDAGAEAIHLEEPEFWVRGGYEEGFKREWKSYYNEDWQPPHSSADAQWRASKLKYFLYRRALQQVFDHIQAFNKRTGKHVHCYVPTHSLINYAHWNIVSPESSLARLNGCDGYIAQVWTGTSRTPNRYLGVVKERTFETAFLEYGAMQNLVHSTGRSVWYLNDPIEDNPNHDWDDYKRNWESTLVASLFQPEVWQYEVAPWPERIFNGRYPRRAANSKSIPPEYATELQIVFNALNDMKQPRAQWDCGTTGIGVVISDSLMFQRGEPTPSDQHMSHFYALALPFLKRGMPITPVQLENLSPPPQPGRAGVSPVPLGVSPSDRVRGESMPENYLNGFRVLLLSYHGQKPLSPEVHKPLADWVKSGGALVIVDDDSDPYNKVREWWNTTDQKLATPREHLFTELGAKETTALQHIGKGTVLWLRENPARLSDSTAGSLRIANAAKQATPKLPWRETNNLLFRRGPYVIASGLDETISAPNKTIPGRYVNLFDSELRVQNNPTLEPAARLFLLDLNSAPKTQGTVLASACKVFPKGKNYIVEGIIDTQAIILLRANSYPKLVSLDNEPLADFTYNPTEKLLWVRFKNTARPRDLTLTF